MKKFFILGMVALAMFFQSCGGSKQVANAGYYNNPYPQFQQQGNTTPKVEVIQEDPVGNLVKQFTADGFRTQSMAFTMRESITKFRSKLQSNEKLVDVYADGEGKTSTAAEMEALNAAAMKYATQAASVIKGGMERDFGSLGEDYDNFHGTYVQNVAKYVMPLLKQEMTFIKKEQNLYVVRVGFIIDENKAADVRRKAVDEALENSANGLAFGEGVRKYINEIVRPEEQP